MEIPSNCPSYGCGLILDVPGGLMSADLEDKNTEMRRRGREHGYVIVQPTAPGGVPTWEIGRHTEPVFDFVADLAHVLGVDPRRRHAMGISFGGAMTWRLMCRHADFFASVAPLAAKEGGCRFDDQDLPSEEVDAFIMHGTKDRVVPFGASEHMRDQMLEAWPFGLPFVLEKDDFHEATRWTTSSGTVMEFWQHDYAAPGVIPGVPTGIEGHCFPGSTQAAGLGQISYACAEENTFVLGDLVMDFFKDHQRD